MNAEGATSLPFKARISIQMLLKFGSKSQISSLGKI